jgi:hypothetical protein
MNGEILSGVWKADVADRSCGKLNSAQFAEPVTHRWMGNKIEFHV